MPELRQKAVCFAVAIIQTASSSHKERHMSSNQHGLNVTKPVSILNRSIIKFSFKEFFKSTTGSDFRSISCLTPQSRI